MIRFYQICLTDKIRTDVFQVYTDLLRRAAEKEGPKSPTLYRAIQDIDDVLQAKLIDVRSKEERAGIKVGIAELMPKSISSFTSWPVVDVMIFFGGNLDFPKFKKLKKRLLYCLNVYKDVTDKAFYSTVNCFKMAYSCYLFQLTILDFLPKMFL